MTVDRLYLRHRIHLLSQTCGATTHCLRHVADKFLIYSSSEVYHHELICPGIRMKHYQLHNHPVFCPCVETSVRVTIMISLVSLKPIFVFVHQFFCHLVIFLAMMCHSDDTCTFQFGYHLDDVLFLDIVMGFEHLFHHSRAHRNAMYGCILFALLHESGSEVLTTLSIRHHIDNGNYQSAKNAFHSFILESLAADGNCF